MTETKTEAGTPAEVKADSGTNSEPKPRSVLVTGDVVADHFIYEGRELQPGSAIPVGTIHSPQPGGAALLHSLIAEAKPYAVQFAFDDRKFDLAKLPSGFCVMKPFKKTAKDSKKDEGEVWRTEKALGFDTHADSVPITALNQTALDGPHAVVVVNDAGLHFRNEQAAWPAFLRPAKAPSMGTSSAEVSHGASPSKAPPEWLVVKTTGPLAGPNFMDGFWQQVLSRPETAKRTIALFTANDLRGESALASKNLSWERAALDVANALLKDPRLAHLCKLRFVIVSFSTDGALLAEFPSFPDPVETPPTASKSPPSLRVGEPRLRLVFDPKSLEGDFCAALDGGMIGYQACLTAAVVSRLAPAVVAPDKIADALKDAIRAGLAAMRALIRDGHGAAPKKSAVPPTGFPLKAVAEQIKSAPDAPYGSASLPPADELLGKPPVKWRIAGGAKKHPLFGVARRVAVFGLSELQFTPYQKFGDLVSVERTEIEGLRTLKALMERYDKDKKADKPLSIAVFGPPGSGKSFGVKALAKAVFGDDVPLLEFNLSQFESPEDLHGLYHQVRDQALRGKTPVVFWDEFDARDSKWLQYLLAPMQDGKFQQGEVTHPIGKCVFVFAGGTRNRFEDFGAPDPESLSRDSKAQDEEFRRFQTDFKAKKGPDFKSRLAGFLNVFGPNRRNSQDATFPIRRALLLRSKLGLKHDDRLTIDAGLLTAFLELIGDKKEPRRAYKFGARSLEKIAEQVKQTSRSGGEFTRSDLPAADVLGMHVNAKLFLDRVSRDDSDLDFTKLGRQIANFYQKRHGGKLFDQMDEMMKADNVAAARRIDRVLRKAGLHLVKRDRTDLPTTPQQTIESVIDRNVDVLAKGEHDGWMDARFSEGWRLSDIRNHAERESHLLVPWKEFPARVMRNLRALGNPAPTDAEVDAAVKIIEGKDRDAVRDYPTIIADTDYRIEPIANANPAVVPGPGSKP